MIYNLINWLASKPGFIMQFEFATATRIVFGSGCSKSGVKSLLNEGYKKALILTGKDRGRAENLIGLLSAGGVEYIPFQIPSEPTIEIVEAAAQIARENRVDLVIGIGGGSVIDCGKAIAAMATNPGRLIEYLEVIGLAKPLIFQPLPYVAIPTTSGTGAEATKNAVITCRKEGVKASLRHRFLFPRLALVDPELSLTVPPRLTAETGLDALTQLIEPFISTRSNPLTDAICVEGIKRVARSLRRACEDGTDISARADMALASLFSGMALANAGLGAVHGFAAPIGGMFNAPHGAVCAALIAPTLTINLSALRKREPASPVIEKIKIIGQILTSNPDSEPEDTAEWINQTCARFKLRRLSDFGVSEKDFPLLIEKARKASSMKGTPIQLSEGELRLILKLSL
jgi:alcohol dehydrogenase class IV